MRLSIATKIFLAFTAVVVIFTGVLMFGTYRTQTLYGRIQQLNHTVVPISLLLSDVQTDLKSFNVVLNERDPLVLRRTLQMTRLVYFLPDRFTKKLARAHAMADEANLDELADSEQPALEPSSLANLETRLSEIRSRAIGFAGRSRRFSALVLNEKPRQDPDAYTEQLIDLQAGLRNEARQLDAEITALRNDLRATTDAALASANDSQRSSLYALGTLSVVALMIAVGVLIAVLLTMRRLTTLTEATKRIGEGDYRPIENIAESRLGNDEITMLTREFNSMAASLSQRDAKLREQHKQLLKSERLATVGRMTSLITHELRNPLSSINLNSEMLQETLIERGIGANDDEVMPLLETITDEVDRLRDITEEYLVYARLPSPQLEPTNLKDVVESLIDFHAFEWAQAEVDIALEVDVNVDVVQVMADPNQLRQALLNIIKNAIEASPAHTQVDVTILIDPGTSDPDIHGPPHAVVRVEDEGQGISEDLESQVFEPFFTTKSNGTGLGLAMTQQIIEEHHGTIAVTTPTGHGAAFVIRLPLRAANDDQQHPDQHKPDQHEAGPHGVGDPDAHQTTVVSKESA
jgi:signal transduction histidine kinase